MRWRRTSDDARVRPQQRPPTHKQPQQRRGRQLRRGRRLGPGVVRVRDSKTPDGPVLLLSPLAWHTFVRTARQSH
ncbi:DUF397 domain-containing protein [Streptomyces griseorubiginosus]|uniref:DUF397 domain-containing protein n=1 Tax=Streptomyces griseorubiginosus TaxID=67304 RepID=UPI003AF396C8